MIDRARRHGYCSPDLPTFDELCDAADDELFRKTVRLSGDDGITNEHIIFGTSDLYVHLCLLFNSLLRHCFVPAEFLFWYNNPIAEE